MSNIEKLEEWFNKETCKGLISVNVDLTHVLTCPWEFNAEELAWEALNILNNVSAENKIYE